MQVPPAQFGHLAEPRPTRPQHGDQRPVLARSIGRRGQLHTVDRIQRQPVSATAIASTWRARAGASRLGEQPEHFESVQAFNAHPPPLSSQSDLDTRRGGRHPGSGGRHRQGWPAARRLLYRRRTRRRNPAQAGLGRTDERPTAVNSPNSAQLISAR